MVNFAPSVLITGFRRAENLSKILHICVQAGISRIYVSLDGPRTTDDQKDIFACESVLDKFEKNFGGSLVRRSFQVNQGAAFSVLSGCDWIFRTEEFAIIIEDDCLPSLDFFKYVQDAKRFLSLNSNILLIGGTQFVPPEITRDRWFLCDYPLIWGWATSKEKWALLRQELQALKYKKFKIMKTPEYAFWEAGAHRAFSGYVDAWDTPLVHVLRLHKWQTILPGRNLVKNIGNDFAATHTLSSSPWLGLETYDYTVSSEAPAANMSANSWLKRNLYKTSIRHLFTTGFTRLLDDLSVNKKRRLPLLERWN